ncbi:hypothetical protein L0F63_003223 [Massospora cicadina]|nr:hypothetical protein L0F63_003223 [Massospora cicadina]
MLSGESFDLRFERLIRPALEKTGVARVWNQGNWELVVGEPKQIKEILAKTESFPKRREDDENLKVMLVRATLGSSNIVSSDGHDWRRHRRIANPAFKKTWSTEMFGGCTEKLTQLIESEIGNPLQVQDLFQRLTLDVLGKGLFSYDFGAVVKGEDNYDLKLYNDVMKAMFNPIFFTFPFLENWVPSRKASHQKSQENIIRERKAELNSEHDDLLSLMIKASVEEKDVKLSEDDVINDLSVFFLAGHDTTANTLTTTFYYLSKHQDIQEKARQQVKAALKGQDRIPTSEELKAMPYIDCIIKESMRIVSTVQQLRRYCREGKELSSGLAIPRNTFVNLQLWKVHHDEEVYPEPYKFKPERFSDLYGPQSMQWMAFGDGSRMCIGKNFSLMEQRVVLSCLLQKFNFYLGPNVDKLETPKLSSIGLLHPVEVDIIFKPHA